MRLKTIAAALLLFAATGAQAANKKKPKKPVHPTPSWAQPPAPAPAAPAPVEPAPAAPAPAEPAPAAVVAPAPAAPEPPPPPPPPPQASVSVAPKVDVDALNTEYQALRDELFRSRAKVELLGNALYKTRLAATFQYKAHRAWPLKRVTLKLDDQPIYAADAPAADDPIKLYEGFAAPGRHVLAVHVECSATGETRVGYGADGTFTVDVPDGKQSTVDLVVDETGDGPGHLARRKEGEFNVHVIAVVHVQELIKK